MRRKEHLESDQRDDLYKKGEMSEIGDGMDKSDVYGVGEETVRLACVCTIHVRGVNKCMHRGKVMQN